MANKAPGAAPDAPAKELPRSRVLRFEVAADTFATFREAVQQLQRCAGGSLDDDALLLAMARHVLGGPRDDGRSSYQVSLSVCAACGCGTQRAAGELVPVDAAIVAMAACDAQHVPALELHGAELRAANENASLDVDGAAGAKGGVHDASCVASPDENAAIRQSSDHVHVGAPSRQVNGAARADARPGPRAKQSIPPALRRAVLARDQHRCRVPGCTHATFVDVHHVKPRSEGGRNAASNLLSLCSAHHRATHRGELLIARDHDGVFTFRHADGSLYGSPTSPRLVDAHAKVFAALRHLGFREGEVQAVLGELRGDVELTSASVEHLLREALRRIKPMAR